MAIDWCRRHGQSLAETTYADRGVSGWKGANRTRGALGQLLNAIKAGDTILLEDIDRFSRESPLDSLNALRAAVDKGVEIVFLKSGVRVTAQNFNDPATLFPAFFGSFLANSENEKKAFRVREAFAARRAKLEKGIDVAGRCPCWLDWDATAEKHVVNEKKAKVVRRMFDLCLAGHGIRAIEYKLREEGFETITARVTYKKMKVTWSKTTIARILASKTVLGFVHADAKVRVYPAIVSDDVFYAAQQKLKDRQTYTVKKDSQNKNLFTGLGVCGKCGSSYILRTSKGFSYLCCSGALRHMTKCKSLGQIKYQRMENSFISLLSQTDAIRTILNGEQGPSKLDALRGELADVQKQCEKYLRLIEGDENPARRIVDNLKALETKEADLQREVEAAEAKERGTTPAARVLRAAVYSLLWSFLKKSPIKNLILDGTPMSKLINQPGFFQPALAGERDSGRAKTFGWDNIELNTQWSTAPANVNGFACNPQAICVAAGLPMIPPMIPGGTLEQSSITIPGPDISIATYMWFSLASRTLWCSYDVMFGSKAGDLTAGAILINGNGPT